MTEDAAAAGKTSEQLKDSATYLDWDFATVWATSEDKNGGYPYLRSVADGEKIDEEYTLITNEQELINIRYNLDGKYKLANDITLSTDWIPVGSGSDKNTFNGVLDGNGHTIYGFNVPHDGEHEFKYAAMFASISPKAVVENLNIVCREGGGVKTQDFGDVRKFAAGIAVNNYGVIRNCSFTGSVSSTRGSGGIACENLNTIEKCTVNGNVSAIYTAGGIVAWNNARIVDCTFTGKTEGTGQNLSEEWYVGGIAAVNRNHISYCTVENATVITDGRIGGIAGYSDNSVYNCEVKNTSILQNNTGDRATGGIVGNKAAGHVTGCKVIDCVITNKGGRTGGIAGLSVDGGIYTCEVTAEITGNGSVGGLIGYLGYGTLGSSKANVHLTSTADYAGGAVGYIHSYYNNSSRPGNVSNTTTSGTVEGTNYVGGLVGYHRYYNYDVNTTVKNSHSSANVAATGDCIGGLIGLSRCEDSRDATAGSIGTVKDCSATGSVYSSGNYVGGLIGKNKSAVTNCFATGNVTGNANVGGLIGHNLGPVNSAYALGGVIGGNYVGGFVGRNINTISKIYARGDVFGLSNVGGLAGYNTSTIQYAYATGNVSGDSSVGGLVGYTSNTVLNSYYDKETTGQSDTGKGIPKSTFELMQQMNYISWDFDTVWTRRDNYNDGYAYLTSLAPAEDTEKVTIKISTEAELRNIANNLNGDYVLVNDIQLTEEWTPLGNFEHTFNGSFDGGNFKISNVKISSGDAYVGFFGVVGSGAEIANLTIEIDEDDVIGASSTNSHTGGLAGGNFGKITNCFVNGDVTGQGAVGGLVGKNNGVIANSATSGSVNGIQNVGGLIGKNELSVRRSYSSASVIGTTNVGGMIGLNSGNAISSYATGNITARESRSGGFVGNNTGTISGCSASCNISGTSYTGGFVGQSTGVIRNSSSSAVVSGKDYVGGFAGSNYNYGSMYNCYTTGTVYATYRFIGGFMGENSSNALVENCYSAVSSITGSTNNRGGFSGYNGSSKVTNSYFDSTLIGFNNTVGGTAKTTTDMYTPSSYNGWDFDSIWQFDEETPGYPYLSWQSEIGQAPSVIPAVKVTITAPKTEINVGEAVALKATLAPVGATDNIIWSSSDANTVAVSSGGVIVGMKAGKATISAKAGGTDASIAITVADKQIVGNIISINSISDIHIPFGSTAEYAKAVLPGTVSVVLDNATLISLPVDWTLKDGTEYTFEGTVVLNENITNTENKKAVVNVVVDEEPSAPANITAVSEFALSVSYGTLAESVLASLPESVEATLSDNTTERLMVSWNSYSEPEYNPYIAGEYVISGKLILPNNGTIVNPDALSATAKITVEPMPEKVRNITGAVANNSIEVAYGTELSAVKNILPANAYAVIEGPVTKQMSVAWSAESVPAYNKYVPGDYLFTGTFLMPEDGKITNTSEIKTTIVVKVLPSTAETKTMYVSETIAEIGGIGEVKVSIEENSEMAAGSFCIAFDNEKLTPIDYKVGELIEASSVMVNLNYTDPQTNERMVKVSFIGNGEIVKSGDIITVRYLVNGDVEDNTQIPIEVTNVVVTDINSVPLPIETASGTINAVSIMIGDVNGDNAVNILDAFKIIRYDVGFITLTEREKLAADVDKNGEIDIFDALRIQRYDIGLSSGLND